MAVGWFPLGRVMGYATAVELRDDEFEAGPNIQQERITEPVRYAPPRRAWTQEPPSMEGFYFCRPPGAKREYWLFLDVWREGRQMYAAWTDIGRYAVPREGLEWSGPILEPA